tara:strand:- start:938 stop:1645 length:708 start_codon:yes stop_codon:yes gene_type:complete
MAFGAIAVGASAVTGIMGVMSANKNRQDALEAVEAARIEREEQQRLLDVEKEKFKEMKFENPFAGMQNTYEDLTVNQQAAQFQAQQTSQQRADILGQLRGAAGASGIAGLAQSLANQQALQTQKAAANIGQQEAANQRLVAKGAAQVQTLERQGEQFVEQAKRDRQATLLGMQMGQTTGAESAYQQAQANQMNAELAQQQALIDAIYGTTQTVIGASEADMFRENYIQDIKNLLP